mmetsp:Transcript_18178/g.51351  ORF Transcript_18178/g.51351 Transcript_18178/m.51351 type:complete len:293 (-) Transcript_18178:657-1535(-)
MASNRERGMPAAAPPPPPPVPPSATAPPCCMTYAMTAVALRLWPAEQCTSTRPPPLTASWMKAAASPTTAAASCSSHHLSVSSHSYSRSSMPAAAISARGYARSTPSTMLPPISWPAMLRTCVMLQPAGAVSPLRRPAPPGRHGGASVAAPSLLPLRASSLVAIDSRASEIASRAPLAASDPAALAPSSAWAEALTAAVAPALASAPASAPAPAPAPALAWALPAPITTLRPALPGAPSSIAHSKSSTPRWKRRACSVVMPMASRSCGSTSKKSSTSRTPSRSNSARNSARR